MHVRKIVAGAGLTLGLLAGFALPAGADPIKAAAKHHVESFLCDNGVGQVDVVVVEGGKWTPGLVTTSTGVGIPYEFHAVGTFTPTGGDPIPINDNNVKNAPANGRLATCTRHDEGSDANGSLVVDLTVKISFTIARH